MIVPASFYIGKNRILGLATYNHFPDVYRAKIPSAKDSEYIMHVDYGYGGKRRGIDVFFS